jgi:hypothetical protein
LADLINLKRARKQRARDADRVAAAQNRARHGQTKAEKTALEAEAKRLDRAVDGARREPADDDHR